MLGLGLLFLLVIGILRIGLLLVYVIATIYFFVMAMGLRSSQDKKRERGLIGLILFCLLVGFGLIALPSYLKKTMEYFTEIEKVGN